MGAEWVFQHVIFIQEIPAFMEFESSSPFSQEPSTGHNSDPDNSSPRAHVVFLEDPV
jgi:hypothetical protein